MARPAHVLTAAIHNLIDELNPDKVKLKSSKMKQTIALFNNFFFSEGPHTVTPEAVQLLLAGHGKRGGIVQGCGKTSWKSSELKKSSTLCLLLLAKLIDPDENPDDHELFKVTFLGLGENLYQAMRLDKHILSTQSTPEIAYHIIDVIQAQRSPPAMESILREERARVEYFNFKGSVPTARIRSSVASTSMGGDDEEESELDPESRRGSEVSVASEGSDVKMSGPGDKPEKKDDGGDDSSSGDSDVSDEEGEDDEENTVAIDDDDGGEQIQVADPLGLKASSQNLSFAVMKAVGKFKQSARRASLKPKKKTRRKSLRIRTDTEKKVEENKFSKYMLTSDQFNASAFIAKMYSEVEVDRLREGMKKLEELCASQKEQLKKLVKDNLHRFIECRSSIDDIHTGLSTDSRLNHQSIEQLVGDYQNLTSLAERAYQPLIDCKSESDRIRNALEMLHRFQFLFNMPRIISDNITKGDVDQVVRDYKKARSLCSDSHIKILEWLFQQIETIVSDFRAGILKQLEDPNAFAEDQEKAIQYLCQLGVETDPGWEYLCKQRDCINQLLSQCLDRYGGFGHAEQRRWNSVENWKSKNMIGRRSSVHHRRSVTRASTASAGSIYEAPRASIAEAEDDIVVSVRQLSKVLQYNLPGYWKLARKYISGRFGGGVEADVLLSPHTPSTSRMTQRRRSTIPFTLKSREEVVQLAESIINSFACKVRASLFGYEDETDRFISEASVSNVNGPSNKSRAYTLLGGLDTREFKAEMYDCIHILRQCNKKLEPSVPRDLMRGLQTLTEEVVEFVINKNFQFVVHRMYELYTKETWTVVDYCAGTIKNTPAARITTFPLRVKELIEQTLRNLSSVAGGESDYGKRIGIAFHKTVRRFSDCLHALAFNWDVSVSRPVDKDQCFLITMGNAHFTRHVVLPELVEYARGLRIHVSHEDMRDEMNRTLECLANLENMACEHYVASRSNSINALIKEGMLLSGVDWCGGSPPTEIREYVYEVLHEMVLVHNDICQFVEPRGGTGGDKLRFIASQILCNAAQMYVECGRTLDRISFCGLLQADIETEVLEQVMHPFKTTISGGLFRRFHTEMSSLVMKDSPKPNADPAELKRQLLRDMEFRSRYQLECFRTAEVNKQGSETTIL